MIKGPNFKRLLFKYMPKAQLCFRYIENAFITYVSELFTVVVLACIDIHDF